MTFLQPDREWDQLCQFLGGYLQQDWDVDYATVEDAVRDAAPDFDDHLLDEFDRVAELRLDEPGYDRLLRFCGCALSPQAMGMSATDLWSWLEKLMRGALAEGTARTASP
jgi:hypothetical protein